MAYKLNVTCRNKHKQSIFSTSDLRAISTVFSRHIPRIDINVHAKFHEDRTKDSQVNATISDLRAMIFSRRIPRIYINVHAKFYEDRTTDKRPNKQYIFSTCDLDLKAISTIFSRRIPHVDINVQVTFHEDRTKDSRMNATLDDLQVLRTDVHRHIPFCISGGVSE